VAKKKSKLGALTKASSADLLILILEKNRIQSQDVKLVSGGYYRLTDKVLPALIEMGLVEKDVEEKPYLTYWYSLTEKGKNVAKKLAEIQEIINS